MKNKKLYAALVAGTLAVSMMGTTVLASTAPTSKGNTTFTYNSGWTGPTDPVKPGEEETSPNNWMVNYPKAIELTETNLVEQASEASQSGKALNFKIKQRFPGSDGDAVKAANVGQGISVKPSAAEWNSGTNITMAGTSGSVVMSLTDSDATAYLQPDTEMLRLNASTPTQGDNGYAVVTDNSQAADGVTYSKVVTFTFTRETT